MCVDESGRGCVWHHDAFGSRIVLLLLEGP